MQIDWFTFVCQIINFLVLAWLLKKLLYRPILTAVEERERGITQRLELAADREAAAEQAKQAFENQQAELAHLRDSLMAEAAADVETWKKDQQARVRKEVAEMQDQWHAAISREQQQFLGELRQRTARQVQDIVRHVVRELADFELEQQSVQRFLSQLDELLAREPGVAKEGETELPMVVRTAFPLANEHRETLSKNVAARLGNRTLRFEVDSDLICGMELVAGDRKLEWNVDHYLDALERSIATALDQRTHAQSSR